MRENENMNENYEGIKKKLHKGFLQPNWGQVLFYFLADPKNIKKKNAESENAVKLTSRGSELTI